MSISVNDLASARVERMIAEAERLRIAVARGALGETLVDCGAKVLGGVDAGLALAETCLGGLGQVTLGPADAIPRWPWTISVRTSNPATACLASQYAGWALSDKEGGSGFFALGSGPARALARREEVFQDLPHREESARAVLILEAGSPPPASVIAKVANDCGIAPEALSVLYAPTRSLAGTVQIVARVVEVALHKAHALGYPVERIVDAAGAAPMSPPHPDFVTAMGRTNDAIIYGGRVHLFVTGPEAEAKELAAGLPSRTSRDYGAPFAEVFKRFKGDFYAIDAMLFSPALVTVTAMETGASFHAGELSAALVDASFGG